MTARIVMTAVAAGVLGTLAMDAVNLLLASAGLVTRIDVPAIGRMAAGWTRGRFRYRHPDEMAPVARERLLGTLTHHGIRAALALAARLG